MIKKFKVPSKINIQNITSKRYLSLARKYGYFLSLKISNYNVEFFSLKDSRPKKKKKIILCQYPDEALVKIKYKEVLL